MRSVITLKRGIKNSFKNVVFKRYVSTLEIESVKSFDSIPGPKPMPVLGNMWRFFPLVGTYAGLEQHEVNIRQNEEFGDLVRVRGLRVRPDLVLCFNPKDVEMVYRNEGLAPKRDFLESVSHYRLKMRNDVFQGYAGIFSADGEEWQKARSALNPILMQTKTVKKYTEPVGQVADDFIRKIHFLAKQNPQGEMPQHFDVELSRWTLETVSYMMLDRRIGLLNQIPDAEANEYLENVLNFFDLLYKVDVQPHPWKYISTPTWKNYIEASEKMTIFLTKQIQMSIDELKNNENSDDSILKQLVKHNNKWLMGNIMDMMIAGVDTTSKTMGSMLYYLSTHTEIQDKLRDEVFSVLPCLDSPVTSEHLEKMPYLRAVIKETLRIAPIALAVARQTTKDQVLSGYHIPKGTDVMLCTLAMCRKNEHFPEANKFIPERWLRKDGIRNVEVNPWVYQPFGYGPRSCVGRRLAHLEMEIFLAKMVRNFKMHWNHKPMKFKMLMLYSCADPLKIQMEPLR